MEATVRPGKNFVVTKSSRASLWEVLQLCRPAVIGWLELLLDSSVCGLFKWRQFEPEVILLAIAWYALLAFVPRRRGAFGGAWALGGSRHGLEMGPAVCSGPGAALAPAPQTD
jgi:hypothetical protein